MSGSQFSKKAISLVFAILFVVLLITDTVVSSSAKSLDENILVIYNFCRHDMYLNSAASCGVLANIEKESSFNPELYGDNGTSYGICQWHDTRFSSLINWCNNNGYDYTSLNGQLNFLKYELTHNYKSIYNYIINVSNDENGAYDTAYKWCYDFERPANRVTRSEERGNLAKSKYWTKYGEPYENIGDQFYACLYNPESECQLTSINNNASLESATNDANQLWYFERDPDNGYKITSFIDGTCLDAEDGNTSNGTNVQTYRDNSTNSQRWYFIDIGMDHYSIQTKLGNAYIDAHSSGGTIESGANIQLYSRQDSDAQVYCVNKVDDINSFLAHEVETEFYATIFNTSTNYLLTNTDNNVTLNSPVSSETDASQIWKFERQTDGSYIIRSASNNMCLDCEMGKIDDGTNLQIYEDNGTEAQKWILCDTGNHSYIIKSAVGNAVVDAETSAGEISDGANIQLYHPNGTDAQAYDIRVISNISDVFAEDIGTGFNGYIVNPSSGYRLTNNNNNITLHSSTDNLNQVWRFERQEDNSYLIKSLVDGTCIDVENGEDVDGTNVQTYENNGTEAQRWYFYKKGDNQYTIVSSIADVVLDAKTSAGVISNGANIQLYHPNGTAAQLYNIKTLENPHILGDVDGDGEATVLDATYILRYNVNMQIPITDDVMLLCGDVDGDGEVSVIDATFILRHEVMMNTPYPIGEPIA